MPWGEAVKKKRVDFKKNIKEREQKEKSNVIQVQEGLE